jgi:hypothetical protein
MVINTDVVIANRNILYINSKDTTWLKINADGDIANGIDVHGSLKIYSQIKKAKYIQKKGGVSYFLLNRASYLFREENENL